MALTWTSGPRFWRSSLPFVGPPTSSMRRARAPASRPRPARRPRSGRQSRPATRPAESGADRSPGPTSGPARPGRRRPGRGPATTGPPRASGRRPTPRPGRLHQLARSGVSQSESEVQGRPGECDPRDPPLVHVHLASIRLGTVAAIRYRTAMVLSREDWARAALDALASDGLAGVA